MEIIRIVRWPEVILSCEASVDVSGAIKVGCMSFADNNVDSFDQSSPEINVLTVHLIPD